MTDWSKVKFQDHGDEQGQTMSRWHNPTDQELVFRLQIDTPKAMGENHKPKTLMEATGQREVRVAPKGTRGPRDEPLDEVLLDRAHDNAIRTVNAQNVVIGGYAPQMVKVGEENPPTRTALFDTLLEERHNLEDGLRKKNRETEDLKVELELKERELAQLRTRAGLGIASSSEASAGQSDGAKAATGVHGGGQSHDKNAQNKK